MQPALEIVDPSLWTQQIPWIDHPDADIDHYLASLKRLPKYDLKAKLCEWKQNGVVIFEQAVSQEKIDAYLADIDLLKRNFRDYNVPIEVKGQQLSSHDLESFPEDLTGVKLNQMQCFSRPAAELSLTPNVIDFLRHVFGGPASVCQSLTFWRGSEQPIHIDYPYVCQQQPLSFLAASWVPLEDVHPDSGPLAYYPGGHKTDLTGFFDWGDGSIILNERSSRSPMDFAFYLRDRMAAAGIERKVFCPKRGDVLIWHGNLPHEGTPVNDRALTRKSYVTHYTSDSALPAWMRNHDKKEKPVGVFENGGMSFRYSWFDGSRPLPSWNPRKKWGLI